MVLAWACERSHGGAAGATAETAVTAAVAEARRNSEIAADEVVAWLPTYGFREQGAWRFELHGVVYEPELDSTKRRLAAKSLAHVVEVLAGTELDEEEVQRRLALFLVDSESHKSLDAQFGGEVFGLGETDDAGHVQGWFSSASFATESARWARGVAVLPQADARHFEARVYLASEQGWSIISDVDDTLKVSEVGSRAELMKNTFSRPWVIARR